MRFDGRTAIVTGAGSGIGRAIACRLAQEGANISIADIDSDGAGETAELIRGFARQALITSTDVADSDAVRAAIDETIAQFGRIDLVVNKCRNQYPLPRRSDDRRTMASRD